MRNDAQVVALHHVRIMRTKQTGPRWYAKEWLAEKGLKQSDVVSRTPFNKGQVSEYVNGSRRWNADVLDHFAVAIGVDPSDLLRPPVAVENELAAYVMKLDAQQQGRALRIIKSAFETDAEEAPKTAKKR